ncbi:MAG: hypothetical protein LBT91_02045, partial [Bifidobacteriaceae bacterium]|nr:hypothetical protein [Bifidobacteriaceae bacterium]
AVLALPISSQNIYFFWANVCLCGFALSPIYILADIIINELPAKKNKTLNFSLIGISNGLGNALGIYIIGFTIENNLETAALSIAVICLIGCAWGFGKYSKK